jgi:glycosyltransferase involved in cell wall biosynthesis
MMPAGGIENHIIEFCKNMSPYYDLDLLVANFKMPQHEALLKKYCRKTYLVKPGVTWKRHFRLISILLLLRARKYDVLYTNGNGASVLLIGKMVQYKKWVLHHHMEADPAFFACLDSQYKKAMQVAGNIIACSEINALHLSKQLGRYVDVVYCFSKDLGAETPVREKDSRLHFGYFGRLIAAKGIDLICRLSADTDCSHIAFHIWGSGNEYPASYFKQYHNIAYHGSFNTEEELRKVVSSLNAFLLFTTHAEGLPVSLLEVMSAGVPWISTNKGGIPDIACDLLATRIIEIVDYAIVKRSVLQLADDIANKRVSKSKQVNLYKTNFSSQVLINRWRAVYNS